MNCCWCRLQEPFTDASSLLNAAFKLDLVLKRNGFLFWELKALSYYKTPIHKEIDTTLFLYASKHYAQQAPVDGLGKTCSMYHVRRCFDTEVERSRDWTTDCPVIEMSSILWHSKCTVMPLTSTMEAKILFLNQFWPALALLHNKNNISLSTKLYLSQEACWEETVVPSPQKLKLLHRVTRVQTADKWFHVFRSQMTRELALKAWEEFSDTSSSERGMWGLGFRLLRAFPGAYSCRQPEGFNFPPYFSSISGY